MGLAHGAALAFAPLTSHKDHEIMIISQEVDADFLFLFNAVIKMYNEKLGVYCRSLGMTFPSLLDDDPYSLPAIMRIGSR